MTRDSDAGRERGAAPRRSRRGGLEAGSRPAPLPGAGGKPAPPPCPRREWLELEVKRHRAVALVLDASSGWDVLRPAAREVLAALGARFEPTIHFLGSAEAYAAASFAGRGKEWQRAHSGRARLLGPLFETLETDDEIAVAVLAAGRIFDVEDWTGTAILERTVFVRLGAGSITGDLGRELAPRGTEVLRELDNPIVRVELSGHGVMPFFWDNHRYRFAGASLASDAPEDFNLRVGLLRGRAGADFRATLADGRRCRVQARPCAPVSPPAWKRLEPTGAAVYRECLERGSFHCPHGPHSHPRERLHCDHGVVDPFHDRPQPVYRCLEGKAADARYLVFRDSGSDVEYRFHPCDALELSDFTVAVREGREAALYAYRRETGSWQKTAARFQPYHELDGGCRAALV